MTLPTEFANPVSFLEKRGCSLLCRHLVSVRARKLIHLGMRTRWSGLTVDCTDPDRLATFWGALLDRELEPGLPGWVQLKSRNEEPRIKLPTGFGA